MTRRTRLNPTATLTDAANTVATQIANPATTVGAAAAATFLTRAVSVSSLLARFDATGVPLLIPHRGAGAQIAPENTLTAFAIGASYGLGVVDGGDWRTTQDGALACFHDATTDAVTNKSRTVSDMSATEVQLTTVTSSTWFGGGFPDTKVLTADVLFSSIGSTAVMTPEPKDLAAAPLLAGIVQRMGIQPSVLPNAFDPTYLAPFHAVGCPHLLLNITTMPDAPTRAGWMASGINWIGIPYDGSITPANVTTLAGEGFRILVGTVARAWHAYGINNWLPVLNKIACWASDDPLYFSHILNSANVSRYRRTTDPFATQAYYHGHQAAVGGNIGPVYRGYFFGKKRYSLPPNLEKWILAGWGCPLASPTSYTINFNITSDVFGTDNLRWGGLFIGAATDQGYADSSSNTWETGYQCYYRRNGQINILAKNAGAAGTSVNATTADTLANLTTTAILAAGVAITSIPVSALPATVASGLMFRLPNDQIVTTSASASAGATAITVTSVTPTDAVPSGSSLPQTVPLRIVVTSTQITMSRRDSVGGTATLTDSTTRGAYFFLGCNPGSGGYVCSFSEMVIS